MDQPTIKKTTNHRAPQAYRGNGNHEWEVVTSSGNPTWLSTYRLRVPGGWLYCTRDPDSMAVSQTFVPTPAHVI